MYSSSFRSAKPDGASTAPLASRDSFGLHYYDRAVIALEAVAYADRAAHLHERIR